MLSKKIKNSLSKALSFLPDKPYSVITFLLRQGRMPELKNPRLFNDKLLYLKLNDRNPIYKKLVDKYEVREFVEKTIGSQYLIPLIGVYNSPDEVDFDNLPEKFVLKLTSGAQNNLICKDKKKVNWEVESQKVKKWLNYNPYKRTREWPYKDLPSRFVIEEYIEDASGQTNDYKFWCFDGEPFCVQLHLDRFGDHQKGVLDITFSEQLFKHGNVNEIQSKLKKPNNYEEMINIAKKLSKGFSFVRVDLYNIDGKIYFGEMTFYPANCNYKIRPYIYEEILGEKLKINK